MLSIKNSFHMRDTACNLFVIDSYIKQWSNIFCLICIEHGFVTTHTVCNGSLSASDRHTLTDPCKASSNIEANIFIKPRSESE